MEFNTTLNRPELPPATRYTPPITHHPLPATLHRSPANHYLPPATGGKDLASQQQPFLKVFQMRPC